MSALLLGAMLACTGNTIGEYQGVKISEYFPQDGSRTATYINEDTSIVYKLYGEKLPDSELIDDREVYTWNFYQKTDDDLTAYFNIQWSAPAGDGAYIYGYSEGTDAIVPFDPPIGVGPLDDTMANGDVVTTETSGKTWTSTLIESQDCPVEWGTLDWEACQHMEISDGTPDGSPLFEGEYWQVTQYGTAWFLPGGASSKWVLLDYEWAPE